MSFANDGKTEKPTPKRREKARSEGAVARSMELNGAVVLLVGSLMLIWTGARISAGLGDMMASVFSKMHQVEVTPDVLSHYLLLGGRTLAVLLFPFLLAIMAAGVAVNVAQVGFKITGKAGLPRLSRLNPFEGFKRLFSLRSVIELAKSTLKLAVVGAVLYLAISSQVDKITWLSDVPIEALSAVIGGVLGRVFLFASLAILVIGALDFVYNRVEFEKSLKMTKDEVKEETKQSEGDPKVKGKIREIMIRSSLRRMMKKLPEADVVITNPVHLAVALKYDRKKSAAPVVVARGARKVAERIKEIAREHQIPIVENPPLAQALYKFCEVGQEIPVNLYKAVAEVLAYVYRLKRKVFAVA